MLIGLWATLVLISRLHSDTSLYPLRCNVGLRSHGAMWLSSLFSTWPQRTKNIRRFSVFCRKFSRSLDSLCHILFNDIHTSYSTQKPENCGFLSNPARRASPRYGYENAVRLYCRRHTRLLPRRARYVAEGGVVKDRERSGPHKEYDVIKQRGQCH